MRRLAALLALALGGCAIPIKDGQCVHHVILGLGVVTTTRTNSIADVKRVTTLGVGLTERSLDVGYHSSLSIAVKTNANIVIEADQLPGKLIKVEVH